jgi:hypothetical protein
MRELRLDPARVTGHNAPVELVSQVQDILTQMAAMKAAAKLATSTALPITTESRLMLQDQGRQALGAVLHTGRAELAKPQARVLLTLAVDVSWQLPSFQVEVATFRGRNASPYPVCFQLSTVHVSQTTKLGRHGRDYSLQDRSGLDSVSAADSVGLGGHSSGCTRDCDARLAPCV